MPVPFAFEPGGLLPWGVSIDGDIFCWQTKGASGRWPVVVIGRHSGPEVHQLPFAKFLKKALSGELSCLAIPREWQAQFSPHELSGVIP